MILVILCEYIYYDLNARGNKTLEFYFQGMFFNLYI